jgi:ribosomal protein S7
MLESKNQTKFTPDQHIFLKFIGCLIKQGKKQKAWRIFTETLENIAKETKKHPLLVLKYSLDTFRPRIKLKSVKAGSVTRKLPVVLTQQESYFMAIKWLIKHVNNVKTGNFLKSLTDEIINCFKNNNSKLLAKRKEIYKLAADNRAFMFFGKRKKRRRR